jgi:hypothetical protein
LSASLESMGGLREIDSGLVKIEAGLIEIVAGLVKIEAGLIEIIAGLVKIGAGLVEAPSRLAALSTLDALLRRKTGPTGEELFLP